MPADELNKEQQQDDQNKNNNNQQQENQDDKNKNEQQQDQTPEQKAAASAAAKTAADKAEADKKNQRTPWYDKRIGELTKEKHDERKIADTLRADNAKKDAEIARLQAIADKAGGGGGDDDDNAGQQRHQRREPEIDLEKFVPREKVAEEAAKLASANAYAEKCNGVFTAGKAAHDDYEVALGRFANLGGLPNSVIDAALQLPKPEEIIYHLAGDLDEASRIFSLPPAAVGVELSKIAGNIKKKPKTSEAPDPLDTVSGRGKGDIRLEDDKTPIADWIEKRNKDLAARSGRR